MEEKNLDSQDLISRGLREHGVPNILTVVAIGLPQSARRCKPARIEQQGYQIPGLKDVDFTSSYAAHHGWCTSLISTGDEDWQQMAFIGATPRRLPRKERTW